jgi:CheY-like chemotaxis protein
VEPVRVLVVDDDEAFCEMMVGHLKRKGFQVESAMDGLEAIQLLRSSAPFNVIVTDLMMPGLSGLELLRRAKKLDPLIEVIVITAAGSIEMAISALREDGAYDYLTKPLEIIGELSLAVERAAAHRQMNLEREAIKGNLVNGTRQMKEVLSRTGIPVLAGNEKDELLLLSPSGATFSYFKSKEEMKKKGQLMEPFQTLLGRWRSLGGNQAAWVEMKWMNGEEMLAKIAPLPLGESLGWIIVLQNITYLKRLERFIAGSYAEAKTRIREPVEKAMVFVAELEEKYKQGEGDTLEQLGQLKHLFEEAREGAKDLLTLARNGSESHSMNY